MNYLTTRTIIVTKADRRRKSGFRVVEKYDVEIDDVDVVRVQARKEWEYPAEKNYTVEIVNTYVERSSYMDPDKKFYERYDTPYYCSPSSETYWSM